LTPRISSDTAGRRVNAVLANPCTAALDQYNQHNNCQYCGNNSDNRGLVHFEFSLSQFRASNLILRFKLDRGRGPGSAFGEALCSRSKCRLAKPVPKHEVREPASAAALPNLGAAALDEDAQHNHEKDAADNPDNRYLVHIESPFSKFLNHVSRALEGREVGWRSTCRARPRQKDPHRRRLVHLRAAALNKNAEHYDEQHAGDNPDNRYLVHTNPTFLRC
jgi:hypothetical protein